MGDGQTIALMITAFASMIGALTTAASLLVSIRNGRVYKAGHEEVKAIAVGTLAHVETLGKEINGMKSELVATTAKAAKAEGVLEAKDEQRAAEAAAAAKLEEKPA
jgi:hypothetical protein